MKKTFGWLVVVMVMVGAFYFWSRQMMPDVQVLRPIETSQPASVQAKPAILHPIQANDDAPVVSGPIPALNESDPPVQQALSALVGPYWLQEVFHLQEMVRHIVVTVDNLPRASASRRLFPTKPVEGSFLTAGAGESIVLAPENARRYRPFIQVAEMISAKELVATYVHFYPLFQLAYQDLGYPNGYFNDRLVAVIDHLLAAQEATEPVKLMQPHILYRFADRELEAASAGHKIMIRMGNENAAKLKAKLREIRAELTAASMNH